VTHPTPTVGAKGSSRVVPVLAGLLAFAAGCAKAPPPVAPPALPPITIAAPAEAKVKATMTLTASKDVNPDSSGRPSPIVVRVYQLRADAMFSSADFFAVFNDEQKVLGAEMITHDEYTLVPGEQRPIDVTIGNETRFIGVIAAFRDIRNAQPWRVVIPAPKGSFTISVERSKVAAVATAG
jgi:type VI secretion system protein VasD